MSIDIRTVGGSLDEEIERDGGVSTAGFEVLHCLAGWGVGLFGLLHHDV